MLWWLRRGVLPCAGKGCPEPGKGVVGWLWGSEASWPDHLSDVWIPGALASRASSSRFGTGWQGLGGTKSRIVQNDSRQPAKDQVIFALGEAFGTIPGTLGQV